MDREAPTDFLDACLRASAARHADRVALDLPPGDGRAERRTFTYAQLLAEVDAWGAALVGVGPGDLVAVWCDRCDPAAYAAPVAAMERGAAWVSIDPSFPDGHVERILADATPAALVVDPARAERARTVAAGIPLARRGAGSVVEPAVVESRDPSDPAYLIYTSGTTGLPKGVVIPHRGIVNLIRSDRTAFDLGPGDRLAQGSSHAYDSSVEEIWMAWDVGATVVAMDDATSRLGPDLTAWLRAEGITVACPPPTLLRTLGDAASASLPLLRLLYVGGEALGRDVVDTWATGRVLVNGYGPTECSVTALRTAVAPGEEITIGVPVDGLSAWVVDDALAPVAEGTAGELVLGGPGLALGYRNRPEATAAKFVDHPDLGRIYRTGDAATRLADGRFACHGRIDAQVKLRGFRIELEAIEAELARLPGVREAACHVRGAAGREEIAAWIVPTDPGAPPRPEHLRDGLVDRLPWYMVPARYGSIGALPRTTGGKVRRDALPEEGAVPAGGARAVVPPADELEAALAMAAAIVLGCEAGEVSTDADFFLDLGGTSLLAARWVTRLRESAATAGATVRDVYETRTVAGLAARVRERAVGPRPAGGPVSAARSGNVLAISLVQGLWLLGETLLELGGAAWWAAGPLASALEPKSAGAGGWIPAVVATVLVLPALWIATRVAWALSLRRVLLPRWEPGAVSVWSGHGLRQWMVVHAARRIPWGLFEGNDGAVVLLRLLGARVGRRVHFHRGTIPLEGGWDLLTIGDGAVLCQDAAVRMVELSGGCRVAAPVVIGPGAVVGIRGTVCGGARLGEGSELGPLSVLPAGVATGEREHWAGVPAAPVGAATFAADRPAGEWGNGAWSAANLVAGSLLGAALALPGTLIFGWLLSRKFDGVSGSWAWLVEDNAPGGAGALAWSAALSAVLAVVPTLLVGALAARAIGAVPAGRYPRRGLAGLRIWWTAALVDGASRWLSGAWFWPWWLRLAGMRVGPNCEISTLVDLFPRSVSMERDVFCADGIYLGCPEHRGGWVRIGEVRIGHDSFFGNHAVVPTGTELPPDILLGVCTVAESGRIREGSSWFGLPMFELPRREVVAADRSLTHHPGFARFATRMFWESARVLLPAFPAWLWTRWFGTAAVAPQVLPAFGLEQAVASGVAALWVPATVVLGLKWVLLGRVRPGTHPLWSCWCGRWDFLYLLWTEWALPALVPLEGTLWLNVYLRAMGMRIGKRVVLSGGFSQVVDPDMISIGDDATVSAIFQAHTFEDRVLKIDRVRVEPGATMGHGTVPLYGAVVGAGAVVEPGSVVMKDEALLPGLRHSGAPTRPVGPA